MSKKEKSSKLKWAVGIVVILGFAYLLITFIQDIRNVPPPLDCEESRFMKIGVESFGLEHIDEKVNDYYVHEKQISRFYWDKLCRDLLNIKLNETLSKSENLWLYISDTWYYDKKIELDCRYRVYWGAEGDFYGREIEYGGEFFGAEEVILAQEKRPLRYNESLIYVYRTEEFEETRVANDNPDYDVVLNLDLNESIEVCG